MKKFRITVFTMLLTGLIAVPCWGKTAAPVSNGETVGAGQEEDADALGEMTSLEELNLEDGQYQVEVTVEGGSGRAFAESPAALEIRGGEAVVILVWSSPYYDYMTAGDTRYEPLNEEGNSTFEIPVAGFDYQIPVTADTIAMSTPHEIEYTLQFDSASIKKTEDAAKKYELPGLVYEKSMELSYAGQFSVDYYAGGYKRITIKEENPFLLIPKDGKVPENLDEDITVLKEPIENIYLVATSAMDFFRTLDELGSIGLSGTDAEGWCIQEAKEALENGSILYAGKYNAPDYELILSSNCGLAVESTMIYHTPEVKEKLEQFGIPVLVERSSYEAHPLGRMEWIKLYGALLDEEELAERIFKEQVDKLDVVLADKNTGKTVAFFYISSVGYVNVRKSNDYMAKMIELAGGKYVFDNLGDSENALSTLNMQMEDFYAGAKDADYIIYNSTIDGELQTVEELLSKSALLGDFKAVKEGNVWCTEKNLFQETTGLGTMTEDIHTMLTNEDASLTELTYMHRLQ